MHYLSHFKHTGLAISVSAALLISTHANAQTNDSVLDTVVVQGQNEATDTFVGDAKQEKAPESKATLTKAQLQKFVGLDSAVTGALKYLPGVHSSGGDSSGVTEGSLNIRGFSQDQLGVTRDGIPLNDPQFLTPHADFLGDPENYESVSVLYGSSSINAPTLTASGGSIEIKSVAPTKESGVLYKQSVGSDNLYREFVRVNTGEYKGFSAWLSASRTTADLWDDSDGELSSNRYEGNLQYKWGDGNQINALFSSFLMRTNSYLSPTLAQYRANDYDHGYPNKAYPTLGGTNGVADITIPGVNAANSRADFKIQTYGLNGLFNLSDGVQLKVNPYFIRVTDGTASVRAIASISPWPTTTCCNWGCGPTTPTRATSSSLPRSRATVNPRALTAATLSAMARATWPTTPTRRTRSPRRNSGYRTPGTSTATSPSQLGLRGSTANCKVPTASRTTTTLRITIGSCQA